MATIGSPHVCCICGGPEDPNESKIVLIPKGICHEACYRQIPQESLWAFADTIPCCSSNVFLTGLGGAVVRTSKKVPKDELWFFDDEQGVQARFRLVPGGQIEQLPIPEPMNVGRPVDNSPDV